MKLGCGSLSFVVGGVVLACSAPPPPALVAPSVAPPAAKPAHAIEPPARPAGPPLATVEPFVETLHGVEVRDPYRWMERGGRGLDAFLDAQSAHARSVLAAIPGRDQLRDEIRAANRGVTRVDLIAATGSLTAPRVFLFRRAPDDDTPQIYVRDGWDGLDRLLVDPRTRDTGSAHHAIDYARPSRDGRYLAYGIITGGRHDVRVPVWEPAKFAARLQAASASDRPILLRIESDAGHGHGSTRTQVEEEWADLLAFALWQSGVPVAH